MSYPEIIIDRECYHYKKDLLDTLYDFGPGFYQESLCVYYCKKCGSIFMCRHQYDPGCGSDSFEIYPGEMVRDISFEEEEWRSYFDKLNPEQRENYFKLIEQSKITK